MSVEELAWGQPFNNAQVRQLSGWQDREINEVAYKMAISNIEKNFSFVGLTEQFNESLYLMKQQKTFEQFNLNYYRVNTRAKNNQSMRFKYDSTDEDIELILKNNTLDQKLYDFIQDKITTEINLLGILPNINFEKKGLFWKYYFLIKKNI